jgi:DNA-directed RNA polymerase specialized sigma24 family protein
MRALQPKGKSRIFNWGELGVKVLYTGQDARAMTTETVKNQDDSRTDVADLYRLAFLLTERQDLSIEIASDTAVSEDHASPFFSEWMRSWQRRLVIGRAMTAIHDKLADSARRTQLARFNGSARGSAAPPRNWSLSPDTTKAELEKALLSIDLFPRAVLLLLVFEGLRMADAATLLDADPALIRTAQAIGLRELTANLAKTNSPEGQRGNKPLTEAPNKVCSWLRITAFCH